MSAPMNLLTAMQLKIIDLLEGFVSETEEFGVKGISVLDFNAANDIDELIEKHRSRMPGAFINLPRVAYDTSPDGFRVCDATLEYALLIGMNDRRREDTRQEWVREMHEKAAGMTMLVQLDKTNVPCTRIDFVRPRNWEYTSAPNGDNVLGVMLFVLEVKVFNWQV